MYVLIDTDALVDCSKGISSTLAALAELEQRGDALCTCDIVLGEFQSGLTVEAERDMEPLLGRLLYLETSSAAARQAGRWRFHFRRQGVSLAITDCLIAATAREHGAQALTGNLRDYPMDGVNILPLPRVRG